MLALQKILRHTDLVLGAAMLIVVSMLILPLPHWGLDLGFVVAIATSVIIVLTAVNVKDPLEFSVFPSLLLITTLFRLALSIAATKLILGTADGGRVIETFGNFILGGDFVVGFVAFLILMIVQFIVITNGATRVSEVVARFTLDAMPGKQMAIDADLASGLIDENEARKRRKQVKQEADFYGAMDGASKFVKGDAIASLLIIVVNIIGGFAVGFMRGDGDAMTILQTYAILSVGEGLVSQIPALLISTASGLLVTRAGQERGMGGTMFGQLLGQQKALAAAGIGIAAFGLVPGFPLTIFGGIGGGIYFLSRMIGKNPKIGDSLKTEAELAEEAAANQPKELPMPTGPEAVMPLIQVDTLEIEIGYALTKLADVRVGGDLPDRVSATRRQIAVELGFVMPSVRIRDNSELQPNQYVIKVRGEDVGHAEANADKLLAIDSGAVLGPVSGLQTVEPVFGLPAVWIDPVLREQAERNGYTVVEPSAMIATHLAETVKNFAAELLSRQDVSTLLENAKGANETVVTELVPNVVQIGDVQKVLQHLLRERVPIRDLVTILETMADFAGRVKDNEQLGELVRAAINRTITRQYADEEGRIFCLTLEAPLERQLQEAVQHTAGGSLLALEPELQQRLLSNVESQYERAMAEGRQPVLLCGNALRLPLRKLLERTIPNLHVLAYNEVAATADVEFVGQLAAA
ncbi:MAG TPA: flagellar biosynthesis protein FlhA [Fimbriimonadaceae bacterium]|nr:flagellar biosynthesis protein FlhA [Fimbriimonadaceae bacterium]